METISIDIGVRNEHWYCSGGVYIYVWCPKDISCKSHPNTCFKYVRHRIFSRFVNEFKLKFLIPSEEKEGCYKSLTFFKNGNGGEQTIKFDKSHKNVYVYFYGDDPRPLLFCYNGTAYIPSGKEKYDEVWVKATGISKCVCEVTGECVGCDKLLEQLVKVVGFLNEVDLSKHPTGTSKGGECIISTSSGVGTEGNKCTSTEKNGPNTCTYPVHQYGGTPVNVKVECSPVPRNGETSASSGNCNYKKLIHEPAGINGASTSGSADPEFRLGDIVYNGNGGGGPFKVPYYPENGVKDNGGNLSEHWRKPLLKVTAYFYDEDKCYKDPLLVLLEFKNNGAGGNVCEYYKLKPASGTSMTWEKDGQASDKVKKNGKCDELVKYLDGIRYGLKQVLQIKLEQNKAGNYPLRGRDGKSTGGLNEFGPIKGAGGKQIQVADCETGTCPKLSGTNYKCFVHKIENALSGIHDKVAGVVFTIPGNNGQGVSKPIEIQLYKSGAAGGAENCQNGEQIKQLFYNKCMGDVYVFFYGTGGGRDGNGVDTVPLMLWYAGSYYKPCDRESYFTRWDKVPSLSSVGQKPPCEGGDGGEKLVKELNDVNRALNQIDLDKSKQVGTGTGGYGLPKKRAGLDFSTMRVTLTKQEGPKQGTKEPPNTRAYYKVVHRTYNGFQIGEIKYAKQNFASEGISINGTSGGTVTIKVKNGRSHTSLVTKNKWNTVVVYYSPSDGGYKLPQLILILKTDEPIEGTNPVKGSSGTPYGYYILSAKVADSVSGNGVDFEYKWVPVTNEQVTLDDKTDFSLLNSAVILIDKKPKNGPPENYGDSEIGKAITSASLSSPGREDGDINRITGKDITVSTEATESCLKGAKFKVFTHDISELVTPNGKLKTVLPNVKLIAGLRFLIPTRDSTDKYQELKLTEGSAGNSYLYYNGDKHKVCGYFYGQDPRPLMLCYDGNAYRALNKDDYFTKWVREKSISYCGCIDPSIISGYPLLRPLRPIFLFFDILVESAFNTLGQSERGAISKAIRNAEELVKALVNVSNFLNPVDINKVPTDKEETSCYEVHEFKGEKITIKVESKKATEKFCYHRYTHTHCGTSGCKSNGKGFRLGTINYNGKCIEEISSNNAGSQNKCITSALVNESKYTAASKVVVFYYKYDTKHEFPMVVAMGTTNGSGTIKCKLYYTLVDKANKKYKKKTQEKAFNLDNDKEVTDILDEALFSNSNKLQIILDRRPVIQLYKPNDKAPDCDKSDADNTIESAINERLKRDYRIMTCKMEENAEKTEKPEIYVFDNETGTYFIMKDEKENYCVFDDKTEKPPTFHLPTKSSYKAQLYKSDGSQEKNGAATPPTTTAANTATIQVTLLESWQLNTYGYRCYEHQIKDLPGVEQIGGLKFFLWDNTEGKGASGTNCTTTAGSAGCPSANSSDSCRELCLYQKSGGDSES